MNNKIDNKEINKNESILNDKLNGPYAIIFEYNLAKDKEIAFISCKSINNPDTPKSGQHNVEKRCYYEWVDIIDDFQEAMDKKNAYVDRFQPKNMIKKKPKIRNVELINTSE